MPSAFWRSCTANEVIMAQIVNPWKIGSKCASAGVHVANSHGTIPELPNLAPGAARGSRILLVVLCRKGHGLEPELLHASA